jgi:type IV secretory pathway VirB2 component (pilin)
MYNQFMARDYFDSVTISRLFVFFCLVVAILGFDLNAMAATAADDFDQKFCNILRLATGTPMKIVASIAIIATGVGAVSGKMQWTIVLVTAAGVIVIFSAESLVELLTGSAVSGVCART